MNKLKDNLNIALGNKRAQLVLKNASIVNVFLGSIETGDIAINGDTIVGVGNYNGEKEIDCTNYYVTPGFIDAHVHIESSKVTPEIFSHLLIKKGVTTCIADPHEIANVLGTDGIKFMINDSKKSAIDIFFMMPSCVPAVEFEDNGALLSADELAYFINHKNVLGLGEVMDVPSVVNGNHSMLKKIELFEDKYLDGHCPGINNQWLNAYITCGIYTDHECSTPKEALNKIGKGMYVMLRHGSAAKNLRNLLPAVDNSNFHRFLFCTDDKNIVDLIEEGSIDECLRISVQEGLDPIKAITIATLNAAQCYGLKKLGAIAPGYKANLAIIEDLKNFKVKEVIRDGEIYVDKDELDYDISFKNSMNIGYINNEVFKIRAKSENINVIKVLQNTIETKKVLRKVEIKDGYLEKVKHPNILKIGIFERHKNTGKHFIGFIEGLGIRDCSIAQTIAHDSHNIIVVGSDDKDMEIAVNTVINIGGGIAVVSKGEVLEQLSLPIGGLMTFRNSNFVMDKLKRMKNICIQYGADKDMNIFLTLGFMALPVIPELKITARGLFDFNNFKFIDLFNS